MKRFIFSALACIAFATTAFASNEIANSVITIDDDEFAPCEIFISVYSHEGEIVDTIYFSSGDGKKPCADYAAGFVEELRYIYPEYTIEVTIDPRY